MRQTLGHSLGDGKRKMLKDYGLMGRVANLRNTQSVMEENSRFLLFLFFLLKRDLLIF